MGLNPGHLCVGLSDGSGACGQATIVQRERMPKFIWHIDRWYMLIYGHETDGSQGLWLTYYRATVSDESQPSARQIEINAEVSVETLTSFHP